MRLNLSDYRINKELVLKTFNNKGLNKTMEVCTMSGVPLAAALMYILEEVENEEVTNKLKAILDYYQYNEIIKD